MWLLTFLLFMALHPAEQYAKDVLADKKGRYGRLIKLAVERYYNDLANAKKKGWYFDREEAQRAIGFTTLLHHYKKAAAGKPVDLLPFQQFTWWNLYGWHTSDGNRRFRKFYNEVARKNGKSTESAMRANYRILVDEPNGSEVYCAATKENQAYIIVNDAANMLLVSPFLKTLVEINRFKEHVTRVITKTEPVSYIRAIGRDSKTEDGRSASEVKIDEYHAWDSNYLKEVLEESMKGRANPLLDISTTAGLPFTGGKDSPCYAFRKMCIDILEGSKTDDSLFIMIHSLDEVDDWKEPRNWIKANPSLDEPGCVTTKDLMAEYTEAVNQGESKLVSFKTKSLNIWTDAPKVWITDEVWMKSGKAPLQLPEPAKEFNILKADYRADDTRLWFGGYDGGRTHDFSSWVLISEPDEKGVHDVLPFYWIPDETLEVREKEDRTTYRDWRAKKYLYTTPGNAISVPDIRDFIINTHSLLNIHGTAYDPALFSGEMMVAINDQLGEKCYKYSQGIMSMSPPTKRLEGLIMEGKLRHAGHPVLRWNCRNSVLKIDNNENMKIVKDNPKQRVDGMVALVMAVAMYDSYQKQPPATEAGFMMIKAKRK